MSNFQSYTAFEAPAEEAPVTTWHATRVHDSAYRVSTTDGVMTESVLKQESGRLAELNPFHGTDSIFANARNANGLPVTEILPTTLVEIGGVQAPVSFFVSEGILQRNADGTYGEPTAPAEETPQDDGSDYLPVPERSMEAINAALEPVEQKNLDSLIGVASGVVAGRLDEAALVQKFGLLSGLDAEESLARVNTITAAYKAQADEALTVRYGVSQDDLPSFYEWCRTKQQGATQEAVLKQMHMHDVSGFRALAAQWLSETPPTWEAMKAGGLEVRKQGDSTEVWVRGSWMSPSAAARAGLI